MFVRENKSLNKRFMFPVGQRETKLLPYCSRKNSASNHNNRESFAAYLMMEHHGIFNFTVNHKYIFLDSETYAHTQNIENLWGRAKNRIK